MSTYTVQQAKDLAAKIAGDNPNMADSACLISLPEIGCTTGRITLRDTETLVEGMKVKSDALTGADLAVFPKKPLQPFNTLRVAAKRLLQNHAVQVGDLFMCPVENLAEIIEGIEGLQIKFNQELDCLQKNYDSLIEDHKLGLPEVAHLIEKYRLSWGQFVAPFKFKISPPLAIRPLFEEDSNAIQSAAAESLWDEIAKDAADQYKSSYAGKEKVSQKGINALKKLRTKLVNLSFLDDGIDKVVDRFDILFGKLPKTGYVIEGSFYEVAHFVLQVSDAQRLRNEAAGGNGIELFEQEEDEIEEEDFSLEDELLQTSTTMSEDFQQDAPLTSFLTNDEDESDDLSALVKSSQEGVSQTANADEWGAF